MAVRMRLLLIAQVERVDISEKKMQQLHYKQMKKQQKEDAALK
jgi:hypothetical protein